MLSSSRLAARVLRTNPTNNLLRSTAFFSTTATRTFPGDSDVISNAAKQDDTTHKQKGVNEDKLRKRSPDELETDWAKGASQDDKGGKSQGGSDYQDYRGADGAKGNKQGGYSQG